MNEAQVPAEAKELLKRAQVALPAESRIIVDMVVTMFHIGLGKLLVRRLKGC